MVQTSHCSTDHSNDRQANKPNSATSTTDTNDQLSKIYLHRFINLALFEEIAEPTTFLNQAKRFTQHFFQGVEFKSRQELINYIKFQQELKELAAKRKRPQDA